MRSDLTRVSANQQGCGCADAGEAAVPGDEETHLLLPLLERDAAAFGVTIAKSSLVADAPGEQAIIAAARVERARRHGDRRGYGDGDAAVVYLRQLSPSAPPTGCYIVHLAMELLPGAGPAARQPRWTLLDRVGRPVLPLPFLLDGPRLSAPPVDGLFLEARGGGQCLHLLLFQAILHAWIYVSPRHGVSGGWKWGPG